MSTSFLYHALGIRDHYRYVRTAYEDGGVVFTIRKPREYLACPVCGTFDVIRRGDVERRFRAPPVGGKPVTIVYSVPRVECVRCGIVRQVEVEFSRGQCRQTRSFERHVLELRRLMTIQDVARHLGVGWDLVKEIQKRYLLQRFGKPRLKDLRHLAIDEIAIRKGHRYVTVVLDLERGAVVFVGQGKGSAALDPFWRRLRASRAEVEAVAVDLSAAYTHAVRDKLADAVLVYDRFHIVKLLNEKLSQLRRDLQREAKKMEKKVLKGTRWLLLKRPEDLDEERGERERLEEALRLNQPLATAYYLKEDLRELWSLQDKGEAEKYLTGWIQRAEASGIRLLQKFAKTLAAHRSGILAWYDYPISTGPLEGTNHKIKVMKRQAYGYRDQEFFKLKILALHQSREVLVG